MTAEYALEKYPQVVDALKDESKFMKTIAAELGVNVHIVRDVKRAVFPNRKRNYYFKVGKPGRTPFACEDYYRTKYGDAIAMLQTGMTIRKVSLLTGVSHALVFRLKKMFAQAEFQKTGGTSGPKYSGHTSTPVEQFTKDGKFVARYSSMYEAEMKSGVNVQSSSIYAACYGTNKTAGGYLWKLAKTSKRKKMRVQKFNPDGTLIETYASIETAAKKNLKLAKVKTKPSHVRSHIAQAINHGTIAYGFLWKTVK